MSDERQLNSGSGQQLVTAVQNNKTPNGLWLVREGHGVAENCEVGTPVKCGQEIRLTHVTTGQNLHMCNRELWRIPTHNPTTRKKLSVHWNLRPIPPSLIFWLPNEPQTPS